jgi:hypothetical protein
MQSFTTVVVSVWWLEVRTHNGKWVVEASLRAQEDEGQTVLVELMPRSAGTLRELIAELEAGTEELVATASTVDLRTI